MEAPSRRPMISTSAITTGAERPVSAYADRTQVNAMVDAMEYQFTACEKRNKVTPIAAMIEYELSLIVRLNSVRG